MEPIKNLDRGIEVPYIGREGNLHSSSEALREADLKYGCRIFLKREKPEVFVEESLEKILYPISRPEN